MRTLSNSPLKGEDSDSQVSPLRGDLEGSLPCCYLAPISHYSAYYRADEVRLEVCDYFVKQTLRNRCYIDSPNGALALTIPVVKPKGKTLMRDIRISDHGNWRHQHWVALESSYRQSPFFEYYADDFAPFYEKKWEFLADFNEELMMLVTSLLDIQKPVKRTQTYSPLPALPSVANAPQSLCSQQAIAPLGEGLNAAANPSAGSVALPKRGNRLLGAERLGSVSDGGQGGEGAYYQVFASRHGFLPDLSIVDLLFNEGPEGVLWL